MDTQGVNFISCQLKINKTKEKKKRKVNRKNIIRYKKKTFLDYKVEPCFLYITLSSSNEQKHIKCFYSFI